jgi:hypothetical protein
MQTLAPIRLSAAALALLGLLPVQSLAAQSRTVPIAKPAAAVPSASSLPVTSPTTAPTPPPTPSQLPAHLAQVTYAGGALSISADNSSLNQILREISRKTGITITGGVAEERVFGQYGPGTPATILAALLDGTGSNVLLVQATGNTPAQLVLTARHGGPTPPNPNAAALEEKEERIAPSAAPDPQPPTQPSETAPAKPDHATTDPAVTPATNTPTSSDSGQPDSPNGVKSPQQIYDQLQRLRQQQAQTPQ